MTAQQRRRVTRGYVAALIAATCVVAVALVVASWGAISLGAGLEPVITDSVPRWAAPVIVLLAIGFLAAMLWRQALTLLRGQRGPAWAQIIIVAGGSYLIWSLAGTLAGMDVFDTWLSPYAVALSLSWALANLLFWAVLARRVYTDKPPPRWPWERGEEGSLL